MKRVIVIFLVLTGAFSAEALVAPSCSATVGCGSRPGAGSLTCTGNRTCSVDKESHSVTCDGTTTKCSVS